MNRITRLISLTFLLMISTSLLIFSNYENSKKIKHLNELIERERLLLKKDLAINLPFNENKQDLHETKLSRDFYRYECKNRKRIGGRDFYLKNVPNQLYRVEGAWFICLDKGVTPIKDNCLVLSFGINDDESFDREINSKYGCQIESFDPYVENVFFRSLRSKDSKLSNEVTLQVNEKWRFHRIGLIGETNSVRNKNQIGWMARLDHILNYTSLNDKVVDIFKMDIENGEWEFLRNINTDYLCKYVKQFMLETHTPEVNPNVFNVHLDGALELMRTLEKCFLLFHRDTRFYKEVKLGKYGFTKTEFQEPIEYKIDLKEWKNEMQIIDFMVTYGELYFVNKNFLK